MIEKSIVATDGQQIQVFIWPNEHAKAWVHISHGMAEHAARYDEFAKSLVSAGYAVVAHNHRGHGTAEGTILGTYPKNVNWHNFVQDISTVRADVCADGKPYFIFGHSMGSFIVQSFLTTQPNDIAGAVISGSNHPAVAESRFAKLVAKIECFRVGRDNASGVIAFLTYGTFNKKFKPVRTEHDWLSRDVAEVDKYIADPLCGYACSTGLWHNFFGSFVELFNPANFKKIDVNIPIYILGGSQDGVGEMGKGLPRLLKAYQANGQKDVSLKLYEGGRHEMLNETNKQEVIDGIITWLDTQN